MGKNGVSKEYKNNESYFKRSDLMRYVGIGLMVLSVVLFYFGWGYISYILMCVGMPAGLVLTLLSTLGRSSESNIDSFVSTNTEGIELDLVERKDVEKRLLKYIPVEIAEGYELTDGVMLRKGKNGTLRSSEYTKAYLYPLDSALLISYRSFSLISDKKCGEIVELPYGEISELALVKEEKTLRFGKNSFRGKAVRITVNAGEGKSFSFPTTDSVKTDTFVERVNELIEKSKGN